MKARIQLGNADFEVDLSAPVSAARELDFGGNQPQHFGAPAATSRPFVTSGFSGSVASGASCNCNVITMIPHCNGTHTECVGHLTRDPLDAYRIVPPGLVPALLITVSPVAANNTRESTEPAPQPHDWLITREALEGGWPAALPFAPQALVVRSCGVAAAPTSPDEAPAYLTRQAAQLLVERSIDHLVIDLPSIDRDHDAGRLSAHRVFFGLPPGATRLSDARRPSATVTEFALIPQTLPDGPCLLELQVPAWRGDAVPSRPLLYALRAA